MLHPNVFWMRKSTCILPVYTVGMANTGMQILKPSEKKITGLLDLSD
jgi:hypothetical protein